MSTRLWVCLFFPLPGAWLCASFFFRVLSLPRSQNLSLSLSVCLSPLSLSLFLSLSPSQSLYSSTYLDIYLSFPCLYAVIFEFFFYFLWICPWQLGLNSFLNYQLFRPSRLLPLSFSYFWLSVYFTSVGLISLS